MDSLIRGPKQKEVLLPTAYSPQPDEKAMQDFKGSLIGKGCLIESSNKINRSVIDSGCKIAKNVDISNSIIMSGSVIEEGYTYTYLDARSAIRLQHLTASLDPTRSSLTANWLQAELLNLDPITKRKYLSLLMRKMMGSQMMIMKLISEQNDIYLIENYPIFLCFSYKSIFPKNCE